MNPTTIKEMDAPTRKRFHFAASSFSRTFGVNRVTSDMIDFCVEWAQRNEIPPIDCLHSVDNYFKKLWNRYQK
jgi:hypothetical protein